MPTLHSPNSIAAVDRAAWRALLRDDNPFVDPHFLEALESSDSLRVDWSWMPCPIEWREGDQLVAAAPGYRKGNSHGEFVFDHGWAEASERAGIRYYPKLLIAAPYSPVTGPRLFARDAETRQALAEALRPFAVASGLSSVHVNFVDGEDAVALRAAGYLEREDLQFHWSNDGYATFDDFLGRLTAKRRKEIRRERQQVAREGWRFAWHDGSALDAKQLDRAHELYARTFLDKGNHPALSREFFGLLAARLGPRLLIVEGQHPAGGHAMALLLRSADTLYGRYWGTDLACPGLHFETCYYQGIEYCIANGLARFEPGTQGEHKIARGFVPTEVWSAHWLSDSRFAAAIDRYLDNERAHVDQYIDVVHDHVPYRRESR
jgi:hypothetical protein